MVQGRMLWGVCSGASCTQLGKIQKKNARRCGGGAYAERRGRVYARHIGGATDWRAERGEAGAQLVKQRGRWASDVASIYQRPLLADELAASATVGDARGSDLEQICLSFAQRAVR